MGGDDEGGCAVAQGLEPTPPAVVEQASAASPAAHWLITFEEFRRALAPYTLEFVSELAKGDPDEPMEEFKDKLRALAGQYADPDRKVVSFWTMGFKQHTRGTCREPG